MKISTHPLITALSSEYAREIKALKEEQNDQLERLYRDFRRKYQWLKRTIEVQEGNSADSLDSSSAAPSNRHSC